MNFKFKTHFHGVWIGTGFLNNVKNRDCFPPDEFSMNSHSTVRHFSIISLKSLCTAVYRSQADYIRTLGALAPLASITFVRTVSFSIYQNAKYKYSAAIGRISGNEEPLVVVNRPGSIPTIGTVICFGAAGATAGGIITAVAC